jgi:hypothetical protein
LDERQFSTLIDKLDKLLKLQTVESVKGIPSERDKVEFLDGLGFSATEMDKLLGKSSGYSSVVLYQLKKKKTTTKVPEQPQSPPQTNATTPEATA